MHPEEKVLPRLRSYSPWKLALQPVKRAPRDDVAADFRHNTRQPLNRFLFVHVVGVAVESPVHAVMTVEDGGPHEGGRFKAGIVSHGSERRHARVENKSANVADLVHL